MKFLRKIFENTKEDQREDIEGVFYELLDRKEKNEEGEEYSNCDIDDSESAYLLVTLYVGEDNPHTYANDIDELSIIYNQKEETLKKLKNLKILLSRLSYLEYEWGLELDSEYYYIKVFYKDNELTLYDAFGGKDRMTAVDENIVKSVLKKNYNMSVSFTKYSKRDTNGDRSGRATISIYLNGKILDSNKLIKDLKGLTKLDKFYSTAVGNSERYFPAFNDVKLEDEGKKITIKI